jgi:beta-N-acetylhexosaminidase
LIGQSRRASRYPRNLAMTSTQPRTLTFDRRTLLKGGAAFAGTAALGRPTARAAEKSTNAVDRVLREMTLTEKVGQMFVIQAADAVIPGWFSNALQTIQPGGVLFVQPNIGSPQQISAYIAAIHASGNHIPPFVGVDQEGGPVTRVPGDPVPGASSMAALPDPHVQKLARERAKFLGSFGFNANFAPVADVAYSAQSTMAWRAFGDNPKSVAAKIAAMVEGSRDGGIASAAKHLPGHGRTTVDSHFGLPSIDLSFDDWIETDAVPFKAAIDEGVEMIMLGHLDYTQWDDVPASLSRVAMQHLREDLGYDGVAITDDLGMGALGAWSAYELADKAVDAGLDLLMWTSAGVAFADLINHIQERVENGDVSEERIDESVRRILLMKTEWFPFPEVS